MRVDLISSRTYRAVLPWDDQNISGYGSEIMAAILMDTLSKRNKDWEFHWYAPSGSTTFDDRDNITFHPLNIDFGQSSEHELLDECSIEGLTYNELAKSDFVIDHSARAQNVEALRWYHNFLKYICYRNGYQAFGFPRLAPNEHHFIVPSKANQENFKKYGHDSIPIYYGIPDFYAHDFYFDIEYWDYFENQAPTQLAPLEFFLFLHRPTKDKGIDKIIRLAKELPKINIVVAANAMIAEHQTSLLEAKRAKLYQGIDNLIFVDIPMDPYHQYYLRGLISSAKAMLSPFDYPNYLEGFGITNAIAVSLGIPLIISDSPSTRELWIEGKDAIYVDSYYSLKYAVEYFDSMSNKLEPENKFFVDDYAKKYEELALLYNMPESIS